MKIAHYDANGAMTFYDPEINYPGGVPEPTIEISDADWIAHVSGANVLAVDTSLSEPRLVPYVAPEKSEAEITAEREQIARQECSRRIFAEASANTQINMAAAVAVAGAVAIADRTAEQAALLSAASSALAWVAAMRANWKVIAADHSVDIFDDASWPEVPADAAAMIQAF